MYSANRSLLYFLLFSMFAAATPTISWSQDEMHHDESTSQRHDSNEKDGKSESNAGCDETHNDEKECSNNENHKKKDEHKDDADKCSKNKKCDKSDNQCDKDADRECDNGHSKPDDRNLEFTSTPPSRIHASAVLSYQSTVNYEKNVKFKLLSAPVSAVIDVNSGLLSWMTTGADIGLHTFTIEAKVGKRKKERSREHDRKKHEREKNDFGKRSASQTFSVDVYNNAPAATAQTIILDEDTSASITLSGSDVDGDTLSYSVTTQPTHGVLSGIAPDVVYTPAANYFGQDQFTFSASDGMATTEAVVTITINPVNDAPVAQPQSIVLDEDTTTAITLSGTDIDGDALSYQVISAPVNGQISGVAPNIVYTPNPDFFGTDQFVFSVSDGVLAAEAPVSIQINPVNDAPIALPQTIVLDEDTSTAMTLSATDVDGDVLSYQVVTLPAYGSLSGVAPNYTYTPNANYFGQDRLVFTVSDGIASAVGIVSITVNSVNDAPVALPQTVTLDEDTTLSIVLTGTDIDGDPLTYQIINGPVNGTVSGVTPDLSYTPNQDYYGSDQFTFRVSDGTASADATVSIIVNPVNDAPVAAVQTITMDEDTVATITLSATDIDGDALTYQVGVSPLHGTIGGVAPNLTYTPHTNYAGTDSFTFVVSDGVATAEGTISLIVNPVNDAPVAAAQTITMDEDTVASITLSATDIDSDTLTYQIINGPVNGAVSGVTPDLSYTPNQDYYGSDQFTFRVSDGTASADATVSIIVNPVNDAPVAIPQSIVLDEDTSVSIVLSATDIDGDTLPYQVGVSPLHGTIGGVAPNLTYTPHTNYAGTDSFTFVVSDGVATAEGTISLIVNPVNDAPVAAAQTITMDEDTVASIILSATDIDGDALSYQVSAAPVYGTLGGAAPNLTYTPNPDYHGTDHFTFSANDGAATSEATVSINIAPVNDTPVAVAQDVALNEDSSIAITLTGTDVDGDLLSYQVMVDPVNGVLSGVAPDLTYVPNKDYFGADQFTYGVSDGVSSATANIGITVNPVNDIPVVSDQTVTTEQNQSVGIALTASDIEQTTFTYRIVAQPSHGTLSGQAPGLSYTPSANYFGQDSFTWVANDGFDDSMVATVTIDIAQVAQAVTITPPADIVVEATGPLTAVNIGTATATDGTGNTILAIADNSGPYPLGVTVVTWTATDSTGLTITAEQSVTVQDTTPPEVLSFGPSFVTTYCEWSLKPIDLGAEAYDLVDGDISATVTSTTEKLNGMDVTVIYTAKDSSGNVGFGYADFVGDCGVYYDMPVFSFNGLNLGFGSGTYQDVVEATGPLTPVTGAVTIPVVYDVDGTEIQTIYGKYGYIYQYLGYRYEKNNLAINSYKPTPVPDMLPVGTHYLNWYAIDTYGVMGDATTALIVQDTTPPLLSLVGSPVIDVPVNTTYLEQGANATDLVDGDITSNIVITSTLDTTTPGVYDVMYQATDSSGNTGYVSRTVNVTSDVDMIPPVLTPLHSIVAEATAVLTPVDIGVATAVDGVDGIVTATPDNTGPFALGATAVIWSAQDSAGNVTSATQVITVVDTTPPILNVPASFETVSADGIVDIGTATASDLFPVTITNNAPATYMLGTTTVTWEAVDSSGNTATNFQTITVLQANIPPVVNAGLDQTVTYPATVVLNGSQSYDPDGSIVSYEWSENGVILSTAATFTKSDFSVGSHQLVLTVIDNSGTSASASVTITMDNIPPVANAGLDQVVMYPASVQLNGSQSYDPDGSIVSYEWTENGSVLATSAVFTKSDFSIGTHLLMLTVTDNGGASTSSSVTINMDYVAPMGSCDTTVVANDTTFVDVHPVANIAWTGANYSDVREIEKAFNHARLRDDTISMYLAMPSQSVWDAMSVQEKAIYLINSERIGRGIRPFEGVSPGVVSVAQQYANYLLSNNEYTHYRSSDGASPDMRLYEDPVIQANAVSMGENLAAVTNDSNVNETSAMVYSIYTWLYFDEITYSGNAWGHRENLLRNGFVEDSGSVNGEGLIGVGVAVGPYDPIQNNLIGLGAITVFNVIEPYSTWDHYDTITTDIPASVKCNDDIVADVSVSTPNVNLLTSLEITQPYLYMPVGGIENISVIGTYSDGTTQDLSGIVEFIPDQYSIVSVNAGTIEALNLGTVGITVTANGVVSNRLTVVVGRATDTANLSGTFAEDYLSTVPHNATVGSYNPKTFGLVTGKVKDVYGTPLSDVTVSIHNYPEYGSVLTDFNGQFIIPVNAATYTVSYSKYGYTSVHREISVASHQWGMVDDVVLLQRDTKSTHVDLASGLTYVHQSTPYTDQFGTRSDTLVFNGISSAMVKSADGTTRHLASFDVSSTEYVTPESMPATLPSTTAFTYCSEHYVAGTGPDETVLFDGYVIGYTDNFLGFPVGEIIPVGTYNRFTAQWDAEENGVVVMLLDSDGDGLVDGLDYTGDNIADDIDGDGATADEVVGIENYQPGVTYWRTRINHFTAKDQNLSAVSNGEFPSTLKIDTGKEEELTCNDETKLEKKISSYVKKKEQAYHDDIAIAGTGLTLHYSSQRTSGYQHVIRVNVTGTPPDYAASGILAVHAKLEIAGKVYYQEYGPGGGQYMEFVWDGMDALGNVVNGDIRGKVGVGYVYDSEYVSLGNAAVLGLSLTEFPIAWAQLGVTTTNVTGRAKIYLWTNDTISIHAAPKSQFADGWSLSNHHQQSSDNRLYLGDGGVIDLQGSSQVLKTGVTNSLQVGDDGYYQKGGPSLDYQIESAGVLLDNVTGLRWEQPQPGEPLDLIVNKWDAVAYCSNLTLGGYTDWRLPSSKEWTYTIYKGNQTVDGLHYQLRSTIWYAEAPASFTYGAPVFCVQGETLDTRYVTGLARNDIDEVVIDGNNGLIWQDDTSVLTTQLTWSDAINHCEALDYAGHSDWRLPNANELIYALPNEVFVNRYNVAGSEYANTTFWSSTQNTQSGGNAWAVQTGGNAFAGYDRTSAQHVRCVRDDASLSRTPYAFDESGKHIATYDLNSGQKLLTFNYDAQDKLETIVDRFGNTVTINRDTTGVPISIVSADGLTTTLTVDSNNNLTGVSYEDGSGRSFSYTNDLMVSKYDQNNNFFENFYHSTGRLDYVSDPEGGLWSFYNNYDLTTGTTRFGYTTAEGQNYHTLVELISATEEQKTTTREDGTTVGFITDLTTQGSSNNTCGVVTQIDYIKDPKTLHDIPGIFTVIQPSGLSQITTLSKMYGQGGADPTLLTTQTDINGKVATLVEDFDLRTSTVTSPEGRQVTSSYTPDLLLDSVTIPGLTPTQYSYDSRGRLKGETTGTRGLSYSYDLRGNLASVTDVLNRTTGYEYDLLGRLTATLYPDGNRVDYVYDDKGNLTNVIVPSRETHTIASNSVDKRTSESSPGGIATQYSYDRDRRLTAITLPSQQIISNTWLDGKLQSTAYPEGTVSYQYDCGGKVGSISQGSDSIAYSYDGDLLLSETQSGSLSAQTGYSYNNDFRLTSLSYAGGSAILGYDNDGLLTALNGYTLSHSPLNGLLQSQSDGRHSISYQHNGYGETTQVDASVGPANYRYQLSYDDAGRISDKVETLNGVTTSDHYTYSTNGRLTEVSRNGTIIESYGYDANGNRSSTSNTLRAITAETAQYNQDDQLTQKGSDTYQYDANGRLSSKTTAQGTTTYQYGTRGELLSAQTPDTLVEYLHNPLGQRIAKQVNGQIVEKYHWLNLTTLLATYDANGNVLQRYEYAGGRTPTKLTQGTQTYYILSDYQGTPKLVTDTTGAVVKELSYDSFGNLLNDSNPTFRLPFGYAGGLYDPETQLVRFGHRDYDPDMGRWTARDPIGFGGGDYNLYNYVLGDPIGYVDPEGLRDYSPFEQLSQGYNPRDVRGGFNASGESLVYHPDNYDPSAASQILVEGAATMASVAFGGAICGAVGKAAGPLQNWIRYGPSFSKSLGEPIKHSIRWGASPAKGGKYVEQIGSPTLRSFNQWLRNKRLPFGGWRSGDAGHFHLRK